jgi:hypothetical protein
LDRAYSVARSGYRNRLFAGDKSCGHVRSLPRIAFSVQIGEEPVEITRSLTATSVGAVFIRVFRLASHSNSIKPGGELSKNGSATPVTLLMIARGLHPTNIGREFESVPPAT